MEKGADRLVAAAHELQAISSAGILYSKQPFDIERYEKIRNIAAELVSLTSEEPIEKIKKVFDDNTGYQTPKISTRAAIFNDNNEVLLVKDYDGKWVMPGGWCEYNLSVAENIKKEALEEAGLYVEPYRLVGLFDHRKRNNARSFFYVTHVFMLCHVTGGAFQHNNETTQSGYFRIDNLPELNDHKTSREQIAFCLEAKKNDHWNPIID